ncbi:MAG: hypothetical protein N3C60_06745 [Calditerrivibrio sp.]|nr:hypothetical protein [Calditerrivibrio sp.]
MRVFILVLVMCVSFINMLWSYEPPKKLLNINLTRLVKGNEAIEEIHRLHGTRFPLVDGFVAEYSFKDKLIIMWGSKSKNEYEAKRLFEEMHRKMPHSKVFMGLKKVKIADIDAYYVSGMDMDNYYFLLKDTNYWVAVKNNDAVKVMEQIIKGIKK